MNGFARFSGDDFFKHIMVSGAAMYFALIILI